ncbi:MAG: hypothetical protein KGQ89_05615 [Verrucomicrobia bacterium]|nr:hypothetical protein [Verrucomicrobiota bacterium]
MKQFSVMLQNRVGALAALVKMLRMSAIEVMGLSVQDARDATIARIVVSDPEQTEQLFLEKGIPHTVCELLVVELKEAGPNLLQCLDHLMGAETNIDFAYPLLPAYRGYSLLALHVDDLEFATSVLNSAGFVLLWQDSLSR